MRLDLEVAPVNAAARFVSPSAACFPKAPDVFGDSVVLKRKSPTHPVMFGIEHFRT